jgi:hypothetical protein
VTHGGKRATIEAMRVALGLLLVILTGCPRQSDGVCDEDVECEVGQVCSRGDHLCVGPSEVRVTTTNWTINGQPPDTGNCQGLTLYIQFLSDFDNDNFGFSPVPCETGRFSVDKLPLRYRAVELGVQGGSENDRASFDTEGNAMLDLIL